MKKILVTGGAGFIGSHLVDELIKRGNKVITIDNLSTGKRKNINPQSVFYNLNIRSPKLSSVFAKEKPEIVFHLAAQVSVRKSVENPQEDAKTNILGSLNVLENCKKYGIQKIIFSSTGGALYGETNQIPTAEDCFLWPLSPYGIAKSATEKYLNYFYKSFKLPFVVLRLANVYGPRQNPRGEAGVVAIFCNKLINNERPVINGTGKQTRDYVFIEDTIKAFLLAAENNTVGIFNVGTAKETSVNQIFEILKKILNISIKPIYGPEKTGEQKRSAVDYSKIKKELKWEPTYSLEEGLKKTVDWFKFS